MNFIPRGLVIIFGWSFVKNFVFNGDVQKGVWDKVKGNWASVILKVRLCL